MKNNNIESTCRSGNPVARRRFLQAAVVTSATVAATGGNMSHTTPAVIAQPSLTSTKILTSGLSTGELRQRIELTQKRLTEDGFPTYTPDFVLADVKLDPQYARLYSNFSGDISGRYIEALALMPTANGATKLDQLVRELLGYQRPDGRFGDAKLSFTPEAIGKEHMALLWGNGRLLVGLMAYHSARPNDDVLRAAIRLGDFLLKVREQCSQAEVIKRVEGEGASGLICFTQFIEGLVMLGKQTGDNRYFNAATAIIPLLPSRKTRALHSHGYLSTLRGILLLHEATKIAAHLALVEAAYREIVASPDYVVYGGVLEFFGAETHGISTDDIKKLTAFDNKDPQDEGCSEADFVRLSLQLWRVTGNTQYLELGERCLLNHFFFNQFNTGDFGHHIIFSNGFRATQQTGMAWWCCTMHGLRAFRDVVDALVTTKGNTVMVNLFLDGGSTDERLTFEMKRSAVIERTTAQDRFVIEIQKDSADEVALAIRQPSWSTQTTITVDGKAMVAGEHNSDDGYVVLKRRWRRGERINVAFAYRTLLQTRNNRVLSVADLTAEPIEAALLYGPWLMGVHETDEPLFLRRPWMFATSGNANVISLPNDMTLARIAAAASTPRSDSPMQPNVGCRFDYIHGGWTGNYAVTLRPISEQTAHPQQQTLAVWLKYRSADRKSHPKQMS